MATKAKKGTRETWYDTFAEWGADDQARAIELLTAMNRQTYAFEKRLGKKIASAEVAGNNKPVVTTPVWPCGFCDALSEVMGHKPTCPNRRAIQTTLLEAELG